MDQSLSFKFRFINPVLIFLIILLHSYNINTKVNHYDFAFFIENLFTAGILRIVVPLFFAISGYLFFHNVVAFDTKTYINKLKKRVRSLLIPFLLLSTTYALILFFISIFLKSETGNFIPVKVYDLRSFLNAVFISPIPFQIWFIRDLFILSIISPIIYFFATRIPQISCISLIILWFQNIPIIAIIDIESITFFMLGAIFALNNNLEKIHFSKLHTIMLTILWISLTLIKIRLQLINYEFVLYVHKMSVLTGLLAFWNLIDYMILYFKDKTKIITFVIEISSFSFFIFLFHEPIFSLFKKSIFSLQSFENQFIKLSMYFILPPILFYLLYLLGKTIKLKQPKLFNLVNGKR